MDAMDDRMWCQKMHQQNASESQDSNTAANDDRRLFTLRDRLLLSLLHSRSLFDFTNKTYTHLSLVSGFRAVAAAGTRTWL